MHKQITAFIIIIAFTTAFQIKELSTNPLDEITWPYTSCGTGAYNMTKLTLKDKPNKGLNTSIYTYGSMTRNGHFGRFQWVTFLNDVELNTEVWDCPYPFK